jgi:serine/threonine protein kinase
MGVVYEARDMHLDRFVAIKVLPVEKVADPERKRRFVQESVNNVLILIEDFR